MFVRESTFELLLKLVENNDAAALKFFLKWEKDRRNYLEYRSNDGLSLLHHACLSGKQDAVRSLVDCGADIEARSSVGWTALHAAALSGCYNIVSYLVSACCSNVLAKDDMGCLAVDLTLDSQITSFLKHRSEEVSTRNKNYGNENNDIITNTISRRRHTLPEKVPRDLSHHKITRVCSTSNIARKVRFQNVKEQTAETKSLPGDLESHLLVSGRKDDKRVTREDAKSQDKSKLTKRDSGIYEDFDEKLIEDIKAPNSRNQTMSTDNNNNPLLSK